MARVDYKYVNPFITSAIQIIRNTTDLSVKRKKVYVIDGKKSVGGTGILIAIDGEITGKVVYEFSRGVTMRLAGRMIEKSMVNFENPDEFKMLLESAILELANLISGHAITKLHENGLNCTISPPSLYFGKGINLIDKGKITIVVDLATLFGEFKINLAFDSFND